MLHLGNCIDLMRTLPDQSIDALISDPPYGTTALKFDQTAIDWEAWWVEAKRITKPTAPIVLFAQQPFTTDLIVSNRKMFRYLLVWQKTMPTGFLDANARPLRAHEDILVFAHGGTVGSNKNKPTYNPQKTPGEGYSRNRGGVADHYASTERSSGNYEGRHPTSVLTLSNHNGALWGKTEDVVKHPTAKPIPIMRWLVATYSNPGDTVLDPFAGSGTTGVACVQLGREFIGVELDATYHALASQRIAETQPDAVVIPEPPATEGLFASD
ncbi:DNA-methyltransferase [Deinococcus sp. PEB2-63]